MIHISEQRPSKIAPVGFEGIINADALQDILFNLVIGSGEAWQKLKDLADLVLGNDDDAVDRVAENKIARVNDGSIDVERNLDSPRRACRPCPYSG